MARKRKSGTGTIRQRKDGRWEGRAVVGYDDKGLPKTKNVLAKTKHECQEKLTKLMETVGSAKSEKICADMPFGEWLDFWYQNYVKPQIRPTTQANYEAKIYQHIIPELGKIPLNQLAQKDLQQFYARMKTGGRLIRTEQFGKGLSDSMVRGLHAACRKSSSGSSSRHRQKVISNCFFWTYAPACAGASYWPSSGTTWISKPGP